MARRVKVIFLSQEDVDVKLQCSEREGWGLTAAAEAQNCLCPESTDHNWGLQQMQALFPKVAIPPQHTPFFFFFFAYLRKSPISNGQMGYDGGVLHRSFSQVDSVFGWCQPCLTQTVILRVSHKRKGGRSRPDVQVAGRGNNLTRRYGRSCLQSHSGPTLALPCQGNSPNCKKIARTSFHPPAMPALRGTKR